MTDTTEMSSRIETIERGYEYLLAYAAQGRQNDQGSEVRARLTEMFTALNGLGELFAKVVTGSGAAPSGSSGGGGSSSSGGGRSAVDR